MPELLVIILVPIGITLMAVMIILGIGAVGGVPPVADATVPSTAEPSQDSQ